jgi:asparagine synthase (glutamine-hydrolysing)
VENNNSLLNPSSLVNILTLRYDPNLKPNLSKKTWNDFESTKNSLSVDFIEKSICDDLEQKLKNYNENKVAIALSGGIDSTLVLSLLRKIKPDIEIHAISIKFADSVDETINASKIAAKFNAEHHIIELDNYLSELPKAISMIKLPFWDLHWFHVAKNAKSLSKILISGDGGDELFAGYTFRYKKFLSLTSKNSTPLEKIKAYLKCHERDRVDDQEHIFGKKIKFSWESIYQILLPYFDNKLPSLQQVLLADYNGKLLYNFNPINKKIVDELKIELITPILNPKLISSAPHTILSQNYDEIQNIGKQPLRKILEKNGHSNLVNTRKLGFNVNTINLWKTHGHRLCEKFLLDSRIVNDGWISNDWILKHMDNSLLDVRYVNKFLGILAFEIWYRLFITKELSSEDTLD